MELSGRKAHRQTIPLSSFLCTTARAPGDNYHVCSQTHTSKENSRESKALKLLIFHRDGWQNIQLGLTLTSGEVTNHLAVTAWFQKVQTETVWGVWERVCLSRWIFPLISWHGGNNLAPSVFTQPLREITVLPPAQGFLKKKRVQHPWKRAGFGFLLVHGWSLQPTVDTATPLVHSQEKIYSSSPCRRH